MPLIPIVQVEVGEKILIHPLADSDAAPLYTGTGFPPGITVDPVTGAIEGEVGSSAPGPWMATLVKSQPILFHLPSP